MNNDSKKPIAAKSRCRNLYFLMVYFIPLGVILYQCIMNDFSADCFLRFREQLKILAQENWLLSVVLFSAVYFAVVIFSAPFTVVLNLFAGYLFGSLVGALTADAAVTMGSYALFMFSRSITQIMRGDCFRLKIVAVSPTKTVLMLLFLRLSPFIPASAVNVGCGALGVKPLFFVLTTLLGSLPLILIYTLIGRHLGAINQIGDIYDQKLVIILILLGLLSLAPLLKNDIRTLLVKKNTQPEGPAWEITESKYMK